MEEVFTKTSGIRRERIGNISEIVTYFLKYQPSKFFFMKYILPMRE